MGLGSLNPGCRQECGCKGCFGGIQIVGNCEIRWTTSGDPFAVELLRDGLLVSKAESGSIYSPDSGTYVLRLRCAEADGWTVIDTVVYVAPANGCFSCCDAIGDAPIGGDTTTVELDITGEPWATWFNGSFVLDKLTTGCAGASNLYNVCGYKLHRCSGNALLAGIFWPYGLVGNNCAVNVANRCKKNLANPLYSRGFFAGTVSQNVSQGLRIYEVWYWPRSITIDVAFGTFPVGFNSPRKQSAYVYMTAECYFVRIDQLFNSLGQVCNDFSIPSLSVTGNELPCGNATASQVSYGPSGSPMQFPGITNIPQIPVTLATLTIFP